MVIPRPLTALIHQAANLLCDMSGVVETTNRRRLVCLVPRPPPVWRTDLPSANSAFSFGLRSYTLRGDTPPLDRGNVPLDSMRPTCATAPTERPMSDDVTIPDVWLYSSTSPRLSF